MRRALLQWKRPDKRRLVIEALKEAGREDLIGYGPECLVRPDAPRRRRPKNAAEKPPEPKKPQNKQGWAKAKPKRIPVRARESGDGMGECLKIVIKYLPVLLGVMSVISFTLMGIDKAKARRGSRRIPEKTLFLFTLLGGGIGGTLGMHVFHHKTRHWYFAVFFPLIAIAQIALCAWLVIKF